jgi:glycosyltransferase involved in cell wall biosynthesis
LFYLWFEWALPRVLKREQPDVFVSTDGFMSLKAKELPTLCVIHDIAWKHFPTHVPKLVRKFYTHFVPKYAHNSTRLATVSTYSKEDIVKHLAVEGDKIDVVYNGAHHAYKALSSQEIEKAQDKYAKGNPYFLYLGSIHPRKNVPNLLRAFEQFKKEHNTEHKLVLAGRMAWQNSEIGAVLDAMEFRQDVVFLGYVATEELPTVVAGAYALTYVSLFEGFGIPLLEAMYCDVPSLTSTVSSMPEVVGDAGLVVAPESVEAIAEGMRRLALEEGLRADLIEKGKVQRERFSWDLTAQKMWQALEKTLAK